MRLQIRIGEQEPEDVVLARSSKGATLWLDERSHQATLRPVGRGFEVALDDRVERVWFVVDKDTVHIHAFGQAWELEVVDPAEAALRGVDQTDAATAPMPGAVQEVSVSAGDQVSEGQTLAVIESMKMQSQIIAPRDGVIERVHVEAGENFERGATLVSLEPEEEQEAA